jgi:transposase
VQLLTPSPGVGEHLTLMIAAEIGDVARFATRRKLVGYAGLARRSNGRGKARTLERSQRPDRALLRWAAIEAAQSAWRTNPWNRLYLDVEHRTGKPNPAKSALARKVLIAAWHVLPRHEPFKLSRTSAAPTLSRQAPTFIWPPDGPRQN